MLVLVALGMRRPSLPVAGCITAMAVCASIASYGELSFHLFGFGVFMTSALAESIHVVLVQVRGRQSTNPLDAT